MDITLVNVYAPNIGAVKYIQEILTEIKGEIDGNILIVGDFITALESTDRSIESQKGNVDPKRHNIIIRFY